MITQRAQTKTSARKYGSATPLDLGRFNVVLICSGRECSQMCVHSRIYTGVNYVHRHTGHIWSSVTSDGQKSVPSVFVSQSLTRFNTRSGLTPHLVFIFLIDRKESCSFDELYQSVREMHGRSDTHTRSRSKVCGHSAETFLRMFTQGVRVNVRNRCRR